MTGYRFLPRPGRLNGGAAAVVLAVLAVLPWPLAGARAQEKASRVLFLHAFNYSFPATTTIGEAARKRLLDKTPRKLEIDGEFLDLARASDPGHEARVVSFLREKYARSPPDVIMTAGSLALPFIVKHRASIAPATPVVFTSISPATYSASHAPSDVTGVVTEFDLDKTLALAEALQPDARRIVLIAGSAVVDRRWQVEARRVMEARAAKHDVTYLFDLPYETLVERLTQVPTNAIVVILTVFEDGTGKTFVPAEVAAALARISPAPVYSPYDTYLGHGTVGGFIETFESVGIAAADLMLEMLAGTPPASLPPRTNPGQQYRVDSRAMERWNLSERNLPPGTLVSFKTPTYWEKHGALLLGALGICAAQSAVVSGLLFQRRRRRRAETLLKESEERMTFTAASVNVALWQFDRETDELWATDHARALFGLGNDAPLTRDAFLEAIHPDDRALAINSLSKVTSTDRSAVADVRVVRDGEQRWIRIRARSQSDLKRNAKHLSGIFIDMTDQKLAEIEASLQRQEVAHLMRVSVLGELSGAIAHEINQPLTAIQANAETGLDLLAATSPDLAELRDVLQDIVDDNRRASEVIQRLRNLLKKGETNPVPVDVNDLVNSTLALLRNELVSRRIGVRSELATGLPETVADPVQLQQVLLNLLVNAMDAMAATPAAERLLTISTNWTPAKVIELRVNDCGPGIQPSAASRLFEPFYTTKHHGLGLGLAICSTIIEALGGKISLENGAGGGAVASLLLPAPSTFVAAA
ncbi:ABC transporter substrate binding protein [Bosea sp. Root381]|uniref:sensor histidine kinase n=1 Tax=Bosea sp. Root381 TaxID=1736524 RepID=UPI0009E6B381|nr:ABC transporter substrate binding protein [Bosea sp. Root381]